MNRQWEAVQACPFCAEPIAPVFDTPDGRAVYDPFLTGYPAGMWAVTCQSCSGVFYVFEKHLPFTEEQIEEEFA